MVIKGSRMTLFFSHAWNFDEQGRCTHDRVVRLAHFMKCFGWKIWLDDYEMFGNIDQCMVRGIDSCDIVLFCLTHKYFEKSHDQSSNICHEWTYTHFRHKKFVPVIMEPSLKDHTRWPTGVVGMYLARNLFVDASDDMTMPQTVANLNKLLIRLRVPKPFYRILRKGSGPRTKLQTKSVLYI